MAANIVYYGIAARKAAPREPAGLLHFDIYVRRSLAGGATAYARRVDPAAGGGGGEFRPVISSAHGNEAGNNWALRFQRGDPPREAQPIAKRGDIERIFFDQQVSDDRTERMAEEARRYGILLRAHIQRVILDGEAGTRPAPRAAAWHICDLIANCCLFDGYGADALAAQSNTWLAGGAAAGMAAAVALFSGASSYQSEILEPLEAAQRRLAALRETDELATVQRVYRSTERVRASWRNTWRPLVNMGCWMGGLAIVGNVGGMLVREVLRTGGIELPPLDQMEMMMLVPVFGLAARAFQTWRRVNTSTQYAARMDAIDAQIKRLEVTPWCERVAPPAPPPDAPPAAAAGTAFDRATIDAALALDQALADVMRNARGVPEIDIVQTLAARLGALRTAKERLQLVLGAVYLHARFPRGEAVRKLAGLTMGSVTTQINYAWTQLSNTRGTSAFQPPDDVAQLSAMLKSMALQNMLSFDPNLVAMLNSSTPLDLLLPAARALRGNLTLVPVLDELFKPRGPSAAPPPPQGAVLYNGSVFFKDRSIVQVDAPHHVWQSGAHTCVHPAGLEAATAALEPLPLDANVTEQAAHRLRAVRQAEPARVQLLAETQKNKTALHNLHEAAKLLDARAVWLAWLSGGRALGVVAAVAWTGTNWRKMGLPHLP